MSIKTGPEPRSDIEFVEVDGQAQPIDVKPEKVIGNVEKIVILIAAIAAAAGWGVLALHRGETINSVWLVLAAVAPTLSDIPCTHALLSTRW